MIKLPREENCIFNSQLFSISLLFLEKKNNTNFQVDKNILYKEHVGSVGVSISITNLYLQLFAQI